MNKKLSDQTGIAVFACGLHSAWHRGSDENMNGLVHRFRKSFTFQSFGSRSSSIGSERVGHSSRRCL